MSKSFIVNNPFFRLLSPLFTGVFAYLLILMLNNDIANLPYIFKGQEVYMCIGLTYLLSESQRLLIFFFQRKRPVLSTYQITVQLISGILVTVTLITAAISLYFQWFLNFSVSESQIIIFNIVYSILTLLYHLLFISNYYYYQQNTEHLEKEEQLKEDIAQNMIAYRHRVNPQLLYHSLETLITLVHKDAYEAEDFVDHLSAVYRHILSNRYKDLVSLDQELNAVRHIIFLLNHEYNGLVYFEKQLEQNPKEILVIPGTLTVLVEQLVRRNIITPLSPMRIELTDELMDGYLVIKSTLNERLYQHETFDQLNKSLQKAYSYYSEKPIVVVKAHTDNFLKLPLLQEVPKQEFAI